MKATAMDNDDCEVANVPMVWFNQSNPKDGKYPDTFALVGSLKQELAGLYKTLPYQELAWLRVSHYNLMVALKNAEYEGIHLRADKKKLSADLQVACKEVFDLKEQLHQQQQHHQQQRQILIG